MITYPITGMGQTHQRVRMLTVSRTNGNSHSTFRVANTLLGVKMGKIKAEALLEKESELFV